VGGKAFNTWEQIPAGFLEFCRMQIPEHLRPGAKNQEMIGRIVAQNTPELSNGKVFGDCDETHAQIAARAHGRVSIGQVASALKSLDGNVFLITHKPAKGRSGTHRTFHPDLALKIATWERGGAEPTPQDVALWDERLYGLGCRPQRSGIERERSGVNPTPPIEGPITSTYKTPKSVGVVQNPTHLILESNATLSKAALKAEMDQLEDLARVAADPAERQRLLRRFCEKRTEYFSV